MKIISIYCDIAVEGLSFLMGSISIHVRVCLLISTAKQFIQLGLKLGLGTIIRGQNKKSFLSTFYVSDNC